LLLLALLLRAPFIILREQPFALRVVLLGLRAHRCNLLLLSFQLLTFLFALGVAVLVELLNLGLLISDVLANGGSN